MIDINKSNEPNSSDKRSLKRRSKRKSGKKKLKQIKD
jgi:hypothetical protein